MTSFGGDLAVDERTCRGVADDACAVVAAAAADAVVAAAAVAAAAETAATEVDSSNEGTHYLWKEMAMGRRPGGRRSHPVRVVGYRYRAPNYSFLPHTSYSAAAASSRKGDP